MLKEEIELRKAGKVPSKEFLDEKKRLAKSKIDKANADYKSTKRDYLTEKQDEYLRNIDEINQLNKAHGLPQIRMEVKYVKASKQTDFAEPPCKEQPPPPKKKGKKKKTTETADKLK